jgi:hypothetical protein
MFRAAVPEASVNEDGKAFALKNEVGAAGNGLMTTPASDSVRAENGGKL